MKNTHSLALVTGGSSGIGKAISTKLSKKYHVINADIHTPENENGKIKHVKCDITLAGDVDNLVEEFSRHGQPEVLVLNAGRGIHEKLREGDPEKWCEVINLNICGMLRVLRAVLPFMKKGNVIFISSVSAGKPHPYGGVYAATKSAMNTIAETLRLEEQPEVKVTVISAGIVDTAFFDRMISTGHSPQDIGWGSVHPDEVADAVQFILNQKPETDINQLTIRPSKQVL
ncbi:MAG: SDR family oxidoreductase [Bacteroidales bacterium]